MCYKNNKLPILFLMFLISFSCNCQHTNSEKTPSSNYKNSKKNKNVHKIENRKSEFHKENESIGVVALREDYGNTEIKLYNENGSVWKSFIVTDNFKGNGINPFVLKSDDRLLVFEVFDVNNLFYVVKVDENRNLFKFVKKSDTNFIYESWEKHILKVFAVDFDYKSNPLKEKPFDNSKTKTYDNEQFYHPVKIKDEWLMVKDDNDDDSWIKWKDSEGKLIITLYYSA